MHKDLQAERFHELLQLLAPAVRVGDATDVTPAASAKFFLGQVLGQVLG
jgi:hypothetical protein